jgi:hypothetical protein
MTEAPDENESAGLKSTFFTGQKSCLGPLAAADEVSEGWRLIISVNSLPDHQHQQPIAGWIYDFCVHMHIQPGEKSSTCIGVPRRAELR